MSELTNPIPAEETTQDTSEGFESRESEEADDWDDVDLSDVQDDDPDQGESEDEGTTDTTDEADQQKEEPVEEEKPADENPEQEGQEEADQPTFDLKYMGEIKTVGKEEVVTLAQKGMNYDRILGERDTAKAEVSRLQEYETFLQELAQPQGMSVEDLIDNTRAQLLADKENLDPGVALQRVKLDKERKAFEADRDQKQKAQQAKDQETARRQDSFLRFYREYPDVEPKSIPKEVWDQFGAGTDLAGAYARFEAKSLRAQLQEAKEKLEAAETNAKNKERSTGSQQTAGAEQQMDSIDRDWYDGT